MSCPLAGGAPHSCASRTSVPVGGPPGRVRGACVRARFYCVVACGTVIFFVHLFLVTVAWKAIAVVLWVVLSIVGRLPIFRRYMLALDWRRLRLPTSAPWRAVHRVCRQARRKQTPTYLATKLSVDLHPLDRIEVISVSRRRPLHRMRRRARRLRHGLNGIPSSGECDRHKRCSGHLVAQPRLS